MEDIRITLTKIESGVAHLGKGFDDHAEEDRQRHDVNVTTLRRMEGKQDVTNGRVNDHETRLALHADALATLKGASNAWLLELTRYVLVVGATYGVLKALKVIP